MALSRPFKMRSIRWLQRQMSQRRITGASKRSEQGGRRNGGIGRVRGNGLGNKPARRWRLLNSANPMFMWSIGGH